MVEREDAQISAAMALSVSAVLRVIVNRLELAAQSASSSSCPAVHSSNSLPEGLNRSGNPSAPSSIMRPPEAMALSRTSFSARLIKGGYKHTAVGGAGEALPLIFLEFTGCPCAVHHHRAAVEIFQQKYIAVCGILAGAYAQVVVTPE